MSTALATKSNVQQAMVGVADLDIDDANNYYATLNVRGAQILGVATAEDNIYKPVEWYCKLPSSMQEPFTKIYVTFKDNTPEPVVITYAINATPIQPRGSFGGSSASNTNSFSLRANL